MFYDNNLNTVLFRTTDAERAAQIARCMATTTGTVADNNMAKLRERIFDEVVSYFNFFNVAFSNIIHSLTISLPIILLTNGLTS